MAATWASYSQAVKHAYCGNDGVLQVVYFDGKAKQQPKEALQVGCDGVVVANDKSTVGWSAWLRTVAPPTR